MVDRVAVADQALKLLPREGKRDFIVDWAVALAWDQDCAATDGTLYPDGTDLSEAEQSNMEVKYFRPVLTPSIR